MSDLQRPSDFFTATEIAQLRKISNWRGALSVAHCWGVIIATWVVVATWTNPLTVLLGIMIIGTRQLGLFVLTHDASHMALFSNRKANDWVAQWILNRPHTDASIDVYRRYHIQHHLHTQQSEDPDLELSAPFPVDKQSLRRKFIRDLAGQTGWKQYQRLFKSAFSGDTLGAKLSKGCARLGPNIAINLAFLLAFSIAGVWYLYFLLWLVPSLTWYRLVVRVRNIGEHAVVPDDNDRLRNTRTTRANWLERAFIAPYHVQYHLEHHLIVNCPHYRLPLAHRFLLDKGLAEKMEIQPGYPTVLRLATDAAA
jgi:fatty acid desaturase